VLQFIDVKMIQSIVAMIPHMPAIGSQEPTQRYFLVEKPGLDIALMAGIQEELLDKPEVLAQTILPSGLPV
jgi:hypothetical protein